MMAGRKRASDFLHAIFCKKKESQVLEAREKSFRYFAALHNLVNLQLVEILEYAICTRKDDV